MRTADEQLPIAYGSLKPNPTFPGAFIMKVKCPNCGKRHIHGWPKSSGTTPQRRVPHCASKYGGMSNPDYMVAPNAVGIKKLSK